MSPEAAPKPAGRGAAPLAPDQGLLAANLASLGARFPELAALVSGAEYPGGYPPLEPFLAAKGSPSARLGALALHSAYDPGLEAARLAAALPAAADTVLVLGFGLGYAAEAALAAGLERVLVAEAEPGFLRAALALRDLRALLADERLGFVAGGRGEGLLCALEASGARRIGWLRLAAAEAASPEWYEVARAAAERFSAKESINENTLRRFGRLWVRNLAKNLPLVGRLPGTALLEGRFAGLPALVLAAGPSLDEVLPRLRDLRERCLLVCVDTALRSLLRAGVEPDFLVVVDPQYWNWRHLEGLRSPGSILVSESAAWPAVFRFEARAAFLGGSLFPLGRAIERAVGAKGELGAGGSVATSAWDLARLLGAAPLYMAGLDLSFPAGATHARASLFEQRALAAGRRLGPSESAQAAALLSAEPRGAPDNSGGLVRTDKRMTLYAWWFESRLARPASPATRTLSARGLAIPGMPLTDLEAILALPPRRAELDARLAAAAELAAGYARESGAAARAEAGRAALLADLGRIEATAFGAEALAREAGAALAAGAHAGDAVVARALDRLAAADAELLGNESRDVAGFLLPPMDELLGRRPRDLRESLAQSEALYHSVADSARYHLEALA
ncbi:MAG: DUF115 domain-containing protein [Spirochaetaceae bacterium]|nr:DUF115 domain-containing protein [Spirochaetaceae bacterium]